jgi:hypothetical protein
LAPSGTRSVGARYRLRNNESDLRRFVRHLLQESKPSGLIIPDQNVINVATEPNVSSPSINDLRQFVVNHA